VEARSWVELVPLSGGWAVPFPPVPTLFYLPVAAIMGAKPWNEELSVSIMPAMLGGASVGLAYLVLRERLTASRQAALWITVAFATTTLWWVAGMGGTHLMAQVTAVLFILLALYLALGNQLPLLAGLCFGLAVGSRLPMVMSLPLLVYLYRGRWWLFILGAAPIAALVGAYNLARFGSPLNSGYALIPSGTGLVTDEPWYSHGIESVAYIPNGLHAMLLSGLDVKPSWQGASLLLTAPFLLWSFAGRDRLALIAGASAALVLLIDLMHGNPGAAQFGYRFGLDAIPLLLVPIGLAIKSRPSWAFQGAVVIGALVSLWGVWAINVLGWVS
jgi:hypothetical protein